MTLAASLALAGSAQASGYWNVVYDFAPTSNVETTNPGGVFNDPLSGTIRMHLDAPSSTATMITGARLISGNTLVMLNQPAGILTVTGSTNVALSPPPSGTPATIAGSVLNLAVVANSTTSGFLHCYDGTGPGGFCSLFFSSVSASNTIPQTGTGPFTFPSFTYTGNAGFGDFVAPTVTQNPLPSVTTKTTYVGREISRVWVADGKAPLLGGLATTMLSTGLLFSGWRGASSGRR